MSDLSLKSRKHWEQDIKHAWDDWFRIQNIGLLAGTRSRAQVREAKKQFEQSYADDRKSLLDWMDSMRPAWDNWLDDLADGNV